MKPLPLCDGGCGRPYRGNNTSAEGRFCAACTKARRSHGAGNFGTFHRSRPKRNATRMP